MFNFAKNVIMFSHVFIFAPEYVLKKKKKKSFVLMFHYKECIIISSKYTAHVFVYFARIRARAGRCTVSFGIARRREGWKYFKRNVLCDTVLLKCQSLFFFFFSFSTSKRYEDVFVLSCFSSRQVPRVDSRKKTSWKTFTASKQSILLRR